MLQLVSNKLFFAKYSEALATQLHLQVDTGNEFCNNARQIGGEYSQLERIILLILDTYISWVSVPLSPLQSFKLKLSVI